MLFSRYRKDFRCIADEFTKVGLPEHEVGKAALEVDSMGEVLGGDARRDDPSHHQRSRHGTPCGTRSFVSLDSRVDVSTAAPWTLCDQGTTFAGFLSF